MKRKSCGKYVRIRDEREVERRGGEKTREMVRGRRGKSRVMVKGRQEKREEGAFASTVLEI